MDGSGRVGHDNDEIVVEGFKPFVPDGNYDAKILWHETGFAFRSPKVFLYFEIVQAGDCIGVRLFRPFRVRRLNGKQGKGGKFAASANSDLYALLARLLDVKLRQDRLSFAPLNTMLFRITTRTVCQNHRQQPIPEPARYSVIEKIERGE